MKLLLLIGVLALSCNVFCQKKEYKTGMALEKSNDHLGAMGQYKKALYKNMYYTDAKSALKRCATKRVESLLSDFFIAKGRGELDQSQLIAADISTLQNEMKYFSIVLEIPSHQENRLKRNVTELLDKKFTTASEEYEAEKYQKAKKLLISILKEDKEHAQSKSLLKQIEIIEIEQRAHNAFDSKNYFKAYDLYESLLSLKPENEDYSNYLNLAKTKGSLSLAIVNTLEPKSRKMESMTTALLSTLSSWPHPLLNIVEREDLSLLIEEQKHVFSGLFDENTTPDLGLLSGVSHLLITRLESVHYLKPKERVVNYTAYEKVQTKLYDSQGNWRINDEYLPCQYTQKSKTSSMIASMHYKLIEVKTGKIIIANKVTKTVKDETEELIYNGNYNTLYPERNGEIILSGKYLKEFRNSFVIQRSIKSENHLRSELETKIAAEAISQIKKSLYQL